MRMLVPQNRGVAFATVCLLAAVLISSTAGQVSPMPPMEPSITRVLYLCKESVYHNQSLNMLFPPSDVSRPLIDNIATAKEEQKTTIKAFCSSVDAFVDCVKQQIQQSTDDKTRMLESILNPNIEEAFKIYCGNAELINSQFECTLNSLNHKQCHGGVHDVMAISYAVDMNVDVLCSDIANRMKCRTEYQLSSCVGGYAIVMSEFYQALFSDTCKSKFFPEREKTSLYPCVENYTLELNNRWNQNENQEFSEKYVEEIETFCSKHLQPVLNCVEENLKTSQKEIDVMIKKITNIDSVRSMATYVCSKIPDIKPHVQCLMKSITDAASSSTCLVKYAKPIEGAVTNFTENVEENMKIFSEAATEMGFCYESVFRDCDSGVGDIYHYLIEKSAMMMREPQKAQVFSDADRNSSPGHQHPTLLGLSILVLLVRGAVTWT